MIDELKNGLDDMGTLVKMAKQVKRCLECAYEDPHQVSLQEVLVYLKRTVSTLQIGKILFTTGMPEEGGAALLVGSLPSNLSWEGWFRRTHWHMLQQFLHGTIIVNAPELDAMIKDFQDIIEDVQIRMVAKGRNP